MDAPKQRMPPSGPSVRDVDVDRLDQGRALVYGIGVFSGIVTALFPLSVVKTRQMASPNVSGDFRGSILTARMLYRTEGLIGFYRGFGTVVSGAIPARMIYLPTFEVTRAAIRGPLEEAAGSLLSSAAVNSISNGVGGAVGSVASSAVVVPMDVVSSRLMVGRAPPANSAAAPASGAVHSVNNPPVSTPPSTGARSPVSPALAKSPEGRSLCSSARACTGASPAADAAARAHRSGLHMAQHILRTEGIAGLYRGLGISLLTYTPSSAMWWASYSAVQEALWRSLYYAGADVGDEDWGAIVAVQAASAFVGGCISGGVTTPLDVVKTQLQVSGQYSATAKLTTWQVVERVYSNEGLAGFWRGALPRMSSVALWGTCMATAYESLKRVCIIDDAPPR